MQVRFVGDLPIVVAVVLSVMVAVAVWLLYRRETRRGVPRPLSWLLPALRCSAFVLLLLILSGPVLRHRYTVGSLGRVLIFIDDSQSMSLADQHMPDSRKLLIAQEYGWLPEGTIDETLSVLADALREVHLELIQPLEAGQDERDWKRVVETACGKLARLETQLGEYELGDVASENVSGEQSWSESLNDFHERVIVQAESLRDGQATSLKIRTLCNEIAKSEQMLRNWFDLSCRKWVRSGNASVAAALASFDGHSRWSRIESGLLEQGSGLLEKLATEHDLELLGLSGNEATRLWDTYGAAGIPATLKVSPDTPHTDLATSLQGELAEKIRGRQGKSDSGKTAVLIISDGQHNRGPAPLEVAAQVARQGVPIFAVGVGASKEPPDLAILSVEHPDSAHRSDKIRGVVTLKDRMAAGTAFVLQISQDEDVLWSKELVSQDVMNRRIPFELPLDSAVETILASAGAGVDRNSVSLRLDAKIIPLPSETQVDNNVAALRIKTTVRDRAILLIDGRSRWEMRYLRNLFERDEHWEANAVIAGPGTDSGELRRGDEPGQFPADDATLEKYDLIVFGEVAPGVLQRQDELAIRHFVERHGGGIIFIDGDRGHLRGLDSSSLLPLIPVEWLPAGNPKGPDSLSLTAAGQNLAPLLLTPLAEQNAQFWSFLPPPRKPNIVRALSGAEVLVQASVNSPQGSETLPLIVTRKFGAGRVLYCASDESWRWRFKNSDEYHQRFWSQVANWIIDEPFAVNDDYLSLDTDAIAYRTGQQAQIRARLRDPSGKTVQDPSADAVVWKDGKVVARISLTGDENGSGVLRGLTPALETGDYEVSVEAAGFSNAALKARVEFSALTPGGSELELLACNDALLSSVAAATDGSYVHEEQIQELPELLRPFSSGRVIETETIIWQTYGCFAAVIGLLAFEWLLRKRAGLL